MPPTITWQKSKSKRPKTLNAPKLPAGKYFDTICELWDLIKPGLVSGSARDSYIFTLLCMTNKRIQTLILNDLELWKRIYLQCTLNFACNCACAVPDILGISTFVLWKPVAHRSVDSILRVPYARGFISVASKMLALGQGTRCTKCGVECPKVCPFWYMNVLLCQSCLPRQFISDRVLLYEYGVTLKSKIYNRAGEVGTLLSHVKRRVYYFMTSRVDFRYRVWSVHPRDVMFKGTSDLCLFYKEHLDKVLDLSKLKQDFHAKIAAVCRLQAYMNRAFRRLMVFRKAVFCKSKGQVQFLNGKTKYTQLQEIGLRAQMYDAKRQHYVSTNENKQPQYVEREHEKFKKYCRLVCDPSNVNAFSKKACVSSMIDRYRD